MRLIYVFDLQYIDLEKRNIKFDIFNTKCIWLWLQEKQRKLCLTIQILQTRCLLANLPSIHSFRTIAILIESLLPQSATVSDQARLSFSIASFYHMLWVPLCILFVFVPVDGYPVPILFDDLRRDNPELPRAFSSCLPDHGLQPLHNLFQLFVPIPTSVNYFWNRNRKVFIISESWGACCGPKPGRGSNCDINSNIHVWSMKSNWKGDQVKNY